MQHENFNIEEYLNRNLVPQSENPDFDYDKYYNQNEISGMYFEQSKEPITQSMNLKKELESLEDNIKQQFDNEIQIAFQNFYNNQNNDYQSVQNNIQNNLNSQQNQVEIQQDLTQQKIKDKITLTQMNINFKIWNCLFSLVNNHSFLCDIQNSVDLYFQIKKYIRQCQESTINLIKLNKKNNNSIPSKLSQKFNFRYGGNYKDFFMGIEYEKIIEHIMFVFYLINHQIKIYDTNDYICIEFKYKTKAAKKKLFKEQSEFLDLKFGNKLDQFFENLQNKQFLFEDIEEDYLNNKNTLKINKNKLKTIYNYEKICLKDELKLQNFDSKIFEVHSLWLFTNCLYQDYISLTSAYIYFSKSKMNFLGLQLNLCIKLQIQDEITQNHIAISLNKKPQQNQNNQLKMYKEFSQQQKFNEIQNDLFTLVKIFKQNLNFTNVQQFCQSIKDQCINEQIQEDEYIMNTLSEPEEEFLLELIKQYLLYDLSIDQTQQISQFLNCQKNLLILKQIDQSQMVENLDNDLNHFMDKIQNQQTEHSVNVSTLNGLKKYFQKSKTVNDHIIKFLKGQQEILKKTVCFYNLQKQWDFLNEQILDLLQSNNKINKKVPEHLRFKFVKNRYELDKKIKNEVKQIRGFICEQIISKISIGYIFPYIKQMHWKVQNGLFFWFNVFLERQQNWRNILKCFDKLHIKKILSRQASIKYFGAFSKFFKFVKHIRSLQGYEEFIKNKIENNELKIFLSVPCEIFIDLDSIFGYSETTKEENQEWDKDFIYHLYEWLNRDTKEKLFGLDITYDFKLNLELIMRDQKITSSMFSKLNENRTYIYVEKNYKIDQFNKIFPFQINYSQITNNPINQQNQNYICVNDDNQIPMYFIKQSYENYWQYTYKTFKQTTSNYLNYSATGTVQSFKLEKRKTELFKKLQQEEPELCQKALKSLQGQNKKNLSYKSVSKTVCFSYTGESLIKILYWVYGKKDYNPLYTLFLKKEPKKIRHVINSDITSFVKQSYFHDWIKNVLNDKIKERINSLMNPLQRTLFYKRSQITGPNEKWCVELDLKDFHHHFGQSHYQALSEVLLEKLEDYVDCSKIKIDLKKTISEFKDELCKGRLVFYITSEEKDLFQKYIDEKDEGIYPKCGCYCKKIGNGNNQMYQYQLEFDISNGLMSGWKLTSMFGSIFNITLNKTCEQWTQMMTQDILYNENVMGDDTHLKKRYLIGSISHINFVNQIGKIAHPQKQMVSTTILEYLKKKINTIDKTTEYSQLTSLNTILYRKKKKQPVISKSEIQESIDLFNLFLARISDRLKISRRYVVNSNYFQQYFKNLVNFSNDKYNDEIQNIQKLLNSPVLISGAVAGYLRNLKIRNFDQDIDIIDRVIQYETQDKFMVNQINLYSGQCKGIQSNVNKIVQNLGMQNKAKSSQLRVDIISAQFNQLIESTADYYQLKTKKNNFQQNENSQIKFVKYNYKINRNQKLKQQNQKRKRLSKNNTDFFDKIKHRNELQILGSQNQYFNIQFFHTFFKTYLEYSIIENIEFAGLIGELVYFNRQVSQNIFRSLKENYNLNENFQSKQFYNKIFNNLKSLKGDTNITSQLRFEFLKHANNKIFFYLALNDSLCVSVSQKFIHPDLIGFINTEFSKYLIHYLLMLNKRNIIIPKKDYKKIFKKIIITIDYYINLNYKEIQQKIDEILEEKIQSQFQLILYHEYNFYMLRKLGRNLLLKQRKFLFGQYEDYAGFQNQALEQIEIPGVTIVRTEQEAQEALSILKSYKDRIHAWDTETIDLDIKVQSPVGNGKIICAQVFCGPDVPFKNGPRLFIDNFGQSKDLILLFKDYMEDQTYKKVWFNYGFDRHIFYNHGIDCQGFHGDSMQMARLLDSSKEPNQYSLSKLSIHYQDQIMKAKDNLIYYLENLDLKEEQRKNLQLYIQNFKNQEIKVNMKNLFARKKLLKNGKEGKIFETPSILELHTSPEFIEKWINYGTLDSEMTFFLFYALKSLLKNLPVQFENLKNMYGIYQKYWRPFGRILTDMERRGIQVDLNHLKNSQLEAENQSKELKQEFIQFVQKLQPDCIEFNPLSSQQLQQLLFAPFKRNKKNQKQKNTTKEKDLFYIERTYQEINEYPEERQFKVEKLIDYDYTGVDDTTKKYRMMTIKGLGIPPVLLSASGLPSVDTNVIKILTEGKLMEHFKKINQQQLGEQLQENLLKLVKYKKIQTLLQIFIIPLQQLADKNSRIHCSLNINTETGRLSSKNPNLQNQPALDKDIFQTRKAFKASKNKKLIIADYSQLELRVLAHITNCQSMLKAFKEGGDFHSRTALGMFPEIQKELDEGKIVLEKSKDQNNPQIPLLKDKFQNERKKAKTMNFSVAYGKTSYGFAKDWKCSLQEAEQFVKLWYGDRPEISWWQEDKKEIAVEKGFTKTLMGRYRILTKHFKDQDKRKMSHGLRAAINTPIQGGAADIVIAAMVKLDQDKWLNDNKWYIIHQVHDEIILEGPEETAEEAKQIIQNIMEHPLDEDLRVSLDTDASICDNWMEGK